MAIWQSVVRTVNASDSKIIHARRGLTRMDACSSGNNYQAKKLLHAKLARPANAMKISKLLKLKLYQQSELLKRTFKKRRRVNP